MRWLQEGGLTYILEGLRVPPWHSPLISQKTGCPLQHQADPQRPTALFWGAPQNPSIPRMDGEGSWPRAELGVVLEDLATPAGAGASTEPPAVGSWTTPLARREGRASPEGAEPALVVSLLSSKQITGGLVWVPATPSGPGAHRCAPKNARGATAMPQPGPFHPQSGEMGLEWGNQSLGDPKTCAHTAGAGPKFPGQQGHHSHLPLPHTPAHTGTLCPHRIWQR